MKHQSLYRKWRPETYEDMVGQQHITETLKNQLFSGRIAHAYLFCGTRGTGKTTTAKIFSRAVNCLDLQNGSPCNQCEACTGIMSGNIVDVIEIDAASNNGVENIRDIREDVQYPPARTKYKVYIIDEVHMLSTGAFNALLKTLEEPPEYVIFILATTEPHKLPATILSRCQRFDFRRITSSDITARLLEVIKGDGLEADEKGLRYISRLAGGSMRDALSILDQCISSGSQRLSYQDVINSVGLAGSEYLSEMCRFIANNDVRGVLEFTGRLVMEGKDINRLLEDLLQYFRDILICLVMENPESVFDMSEEDLTSLKNVAALYTKDRVTNIIKLISENMAAVKWASNTRVILEVTLVKLCQSAYSNNLEGLLDRLSQLEKAIESGVISTVENREKSEKKDEMKEIEKKTLSQSPQNRQTAKPEKKQRKKLDTVMWNEIKDSIPIPLSSQLSKVKSVYKDEKEITMLFDSESGINCTLAKKNLVTLTEAFERVLGEEVILTLVAEEKNDDFYKGPDDPMRNLKI